MLLNEMWLVAADGVSKVTPRSLSNAVKGGLDLSVCSLYSEESEAVACWDHRVAMEKLINAASGLQTDWILWLTELAMLAEYSTSRELLTVVEQFRSRRPS